MIDMGDVIRPIKFGRLLAHSETPEIDIILSSALFHDRRAKRRKKQGTPIDLIISKTEKGGTVIKTAGIGQRMASSFSAWGKRNFNTGFRELGAQTMKMVKNPLSETGGGIKDLVSARPGSTSGNKLMQAGLGSLFLGSDAYNISGRGQNAKQKQLDALSSRYGPEVAGYYKTLKKKQFLADTGRLPSRIGAAAGDMVALGLQRGVRGIVPSTVPFLVAPKIGRKVGDFVSRIGGKRPEVISNEERAALSTLTNESRRLLEKKGIDAMVTTPWQEALMAAAFGIINGIYTYNDKKHPGGDADTHSKLMRTLQPLQQRLMDVRVAQTADAGLAAGLAQAGGYIGGTGIGVAGMVMKHGPFIPEEPLSKRLLNKFILGYRKDKEDESGPQPKPTTEGQTQP